MKLITSIMAQDLAGAFIIKGVPFAVLVFLGLSLIRYELSQLYRHQPSILGQLLFSKVSQSTHSLCMEREECFNLNLQIFILFFALLIKFSLCIFLRFIKIYIYPYDYLLSTQGLRFFKFVQCPQIKLKNCNDCIASTTYFC